MGINFNRVGDDYVAYGKRGPVFEDSQEVDEQQYQSTNTQETVVKKADEDPNKGLKVQTNPADEDPVEAYNRKSKELVAKSEQALNNLGIKPKSLEYSGTLEDFKKPKNVDEAKYRYRQMRYNGQVDMTDEEIDEKAKLYIENKGKKDKFESTHTFLDKSEYKKAEAQKDAYYKELRSQGKSKKEARTIAYERFGENKYLSKGGWFGIGKSSARKYIERNQDLFYENGEYSEAKHKEYVLEQAQRGNKQEGEAVNYRYSLKERREATEHSRAEGRKTTVHQQGEVAKATGMSTENNNTLLYSAAGTAATFGAGAILQATTGISGAVGQFNACGQLCKGVTFPLGAPVYIKDKGEKIKHIPDIKPQVQVPPVEVPPEQVVPPVEVPPEQTCENTEWDEPVCSYTVQKGSSWSYYAENSGITINGKKPQGIVEDAYLTAQQLLYGLKNAKGLQETRFLPVGSEYIQHSDFSKLFNDEQIMSKYGNKLNLLKDAKIDTRNCVDLNGPVKGKRNPNSKQTVLKDPRTTVAHYEQDCKTNKITVTYQ